MNEPARVTLTGSGLTIDSLAQIARGGAQTALSAGARDAMEASHAALLSAEASGLRIYGLTTGVGALEGETVSAEARRNHQAALLRSHACGVGPAMPLDQVRAMLACRANALANGLSGVRPALVDALLDLLNRDVQPRVPSRGSVGASDLAPLAHVGLALLPEFEFQGREGLALINGLAQSAGMGALAAYDAQHLIEATELATALGMIALMSPRSSLDPRAVAARPHPGSAASADRLRRLTAGAQRHDHVFREPLSTRCAHQVTGATRDMLARATDVLERELNAAVDNPLIASDGWVTSNAAVCQGQHLAETMDALATSVSSLAVLSERRTARLLSGEGNLPQFLVSPQAPRGSSSGLMIIQYTAAALVAELRMCSAPAAIQSVPTSSGNEDHVSMAAPAAARATWCVETTKLVVAIELIAAMQALELSGYEPTRALQPACDVIRRISPAVTHDRSLLADIEQVAEAIAAAALATP